MAIPFEDQESVLKDVTDRLEKLEIPYMLSGSMAMVCYAMMRMTNDIDLVIEAKAEDAERIIKEFETDYYVPQGRVRDAISRKFMFNLLHSTKIVKVDCVLRKDDEFQKRLFRIEKKYFSQLLMFGRSAVMTLFCQSWTVRKRRDRKCKCAILQA